MHRDLALVALAPLVKRLLDSQQLFGNRVSLADVALFPFVRQFANTDRVWFDANVPEILRLWLEGHEGSDLFASVFLKWPVWQEGDPVTLFPQTH